MIYGFTHFCCQIVIYYSLIILEYLEYIILLHRHQQRQPLALLILLVELKISTNSFMPIAKIRF